MLTLFPLHLRKQFHLMFASLRILISRLISGICLYLEVLISQFQSVYLGSKLSLRIITARLITMLSNVSLRPRVIHLLQHFAFFLSSKKKDNISDYWTCSLNFSIPLYPRAFQHVLIYVLVRLCTSTFTWTYMCIYRCA